MATYTYGSALSAYAQSFVDKIPYNFGSSPNLIAAATKGISLTAADCSGFVKAVFAQAGVNLSHNADTQYTQTKSNSIAASDIQPGDLVFFGGWDTPSNPAGPNGIQHVGIAIGNGQFVEEGGNTQNVNVASLASFAPYYKGATRVPLTMPAAGSTSPILDFVGGLGNLVSDPGKVMSDSLDATGISGAISGVGSTFQDITAYFGVLLLALVLIIGGVILLRPQSSS